MNEIGGLPVAVSKYNKPAVRNGAQEQVWGEQKPTLLGCTVAAGASVATGVTAYEGAKAGIGKAVSWIENQISSYKTEIGSEFKGFSAKLKANLKYGGAILVALPVVAFAFKDADKDGKLDIVEAAQKYINPDE